MTKEIRPDIYGAARFLADFPDMLPVDYGKEIGRLLEEHPPLELICGFAAIARGLAMHVYGPNAGDLMNRMAMDFAIREAIPKEVDL